MTRYFFHQHSQLGFIEDTDGAELPDLSAVRREALTGARDLWATAIKEGHDLTGDSFEICDAAGATVLTLPLADALPDALRQRLKPLD